MGLNIRRIQRFTDVTFMKPTCVCPPLFGWAQQNEGECDSRPRLRSHREWSLTSHILMSRATKKHVRQRKSHPAHPAGCRLLAGAEVPRDAALLPVPHAQRPHGGSDLHLEQPANILLDRHCWPPQTQAGGEANTMELVVVVAVVGS